MYVVYIENSAIARKCKNFFKRNSEITHCFHLQAIITSPDLHTNISQCEHEENCAKSNVFSRLSSILFLFFTVDYLLRHVCRCLQYEEFNFVKTAVQLCQIYMMAPNYLLEDLVCVAYLKI